MTRNEKDMLAYAKQLGDACGVAIGIERGAKHSKIVLAKGVNSMSITVPGSPGSAKSSTNMRAQLKRSIRAIASGDAATIAIIRRR